jgi:hypothetical protein
MKETKNEKTNDTEKNRRKEKRNRKEQLLNETLKKQTKELTE